MRIGCTGWSFKDWYRNQFYVRKDEEAFKRNYPEQSYLLNRYSRLFDCTEVNSFNYTVNFVEPGTLSDLEVPSTAKWWYGKQAEKALRFNEPDDPFVMYSRIPFMTKKWDISTPEHFVFTAKVPGMITHAKCLRDCADETRLFLKGIKNVKKLRTLLYEFPSYVTKENSFEYFKEYFASVPKDYTYVVEFRSLDWQNDEVYDFLRKNRISLALSEVHDKNVVSLKEKPYLSDDLYLRLIGKHGVLTRFDSMELSEETNKLLENWAQTVQSSKHAMVFINNNFAGNAPETANYFQKLIGLEPKIWKSDLTSFF